MHFTPCARAALAAAPFLPPLGTLRPLGAGLVPARGRPQGPPLLPGFRSRRAILRRLDVGAGAHTRPQGVRQKESPASGGTPGVGDSHIPEGGIFMANYTEHYQLHQWESEDSFLRTDFNGDLSAIDAALLGLERDKCRAAIGRYTGDGELSYTVSLGARPKLAVVDNTSSFSSGYELGLDGMNERSVIITEDGFRVNGSPHGLNQEGTLYRYYAFL